MEQRRIKYIIHRSKAPFQFEKDRYRKIVQFYAERYPGLKYIDKGIRFSVESRDALVDFDFGYHNMRYRDFSTYHSVIAQSSCALFNPQIGLSDLLIPTQMAQLRINSDQNKVRVYDPPVSFQNKMIPLFDGLCEWEGSVNYARAQEFVSRELGMSAAPRLDDLHAHKEARLLEVNRPFVASALKGANSVVRSGTEKRSIPDLRKYLEKSFDGLNQETKQMVENCGHKLAIYGIGFTKPFGGVEFTDELRGAALPETVASGYDSAKVYYFQTLLFGYLLSREFAI